MLFGISFLVVLYRTISWKNNHSKDYNNYNFKNYGEFLTIGNPLGLLITRKVIKRSISFLLRSHTSHPKYNLL